ncbi:uncharacterized protein FYW47_008650 [Aplochiton taeniatus]
MNWDNQMSSILSEADGSVAKMRERLSLPGKFSTGREDLNPVLPPLAPLPHHPSSSLHTGVQWADLAAIQSQLQIQSQEIESLTQKVHGMDRERHSQQGTIRTLQDEVHRLREQVSTREGHEERAEMGPGADRRMEQWKREVGRELNSLRGHVTRGTSLGNLEESFSSKLRREELEGLRREVDQLKTQLRRQEEDVFLQQSEARETRRQYERSCKTLEELTDSYRTHSFDLAKTVSQYTHIEQDVRQLRATVSELKDEVRNLILRERESTPVLPPRSTAPRKGVHRSTQSKRTDFEDQGSDLEDEEDNDEDDVNVDEEDDDGNLGLESDLSLNDL